MGNDEHNSEADRTHLANPIASALDRMLKEQAARPQDVYRLAILMQGLLESLESPEALETIRFELRALINDMSQVAPGSN